jgi:hypothetical protein
LRREKYFSENFPLDIEFSYPQEYNGARMERLFFGFTA